MSGQIHIQYYKTAIGELILGSLNGSLCILDFRYRKMRSIVDSRVKRIFDAEFIEQDDEVLKQARTEIDEYLAGKRKKFDIPIAMAGSEFQKSVWKALMAIPYGSTASYLDIARAIANEKAVRAVAGANGANALAIIIPCHRIIGSDGALVGYGGGLAAKRRLLKLEQAGASE